MSIEKLSNQAFLTWTQISHLKDRLDASYYNPGYQEIDMMMLGRPGEMFLLGDLCDHVTQSASNVDVINRLGPTGYVPFVSASAFGAGQILDIKHSISIDELRHRPLAIVDMEGVLVCIAYNSKYHFSFYSPNIHGQQVVLSPFVLFIRPKNHIDPAFLANELSQHYVTLQLDRISRAGTLRTISLNDLLSLRVIVPTYSERDQISQAVRWKASIFAGDALGAETISIRRIGATFEKVVENLEARILEEDWVEPENCLFVEWNSEKLFDVTGRVWRLKEGKHQIMGDDLPVGEEVRLWILQNESPFGIFNSVYRPRGMGLDMCRALHLADELTLSQLTSFTFFLESAYQSEYPISDRERLVEAIKGHRSTRALFPEHEAALSAFGMGLRPILALAVTRYEKPYGIFLMRGPDQSNDPVGVYELLRTTGLSLTSYLKSQLLLLPEIAKLGAKRTVSELMHRMNNPLGEIDVSLLFLERWALENGFLEMPVPNETEAQLDAAEGKPLSEFTLQGYLSRIRRAKEHLTNLSRKVRMLAKAEAGGKPVWCEAITIIDGALNRTETRRLSTRCEVNRNKDVETVYLIWADEELIIEALVNVIENALREMVHRPPKLSINLLPQEEHCTIEIIDNGLDDDKEIISDPFDWGTSGYSRTGEGSGFGLPMVRQTFESFRGECGLEKLIGAPGCRFWGRLPAKRRVTNET